MRPRLACLATRFPATLSLSAFGPTRSRLLPGPPGRNLAREFTHAGETNQYEKARTESGYHPLTVCLMTYQGCPVPRRSAMPRVGWFLHEVQLAVFALLMHSVHPTSGPCVREGGASGRHMSTFSAAKAKSLLGALLSFLRGEFLGKFDRVNVHGVGVSRGSGGG